jgi:mono/diheme cytochrome c family protein
VSDEPTGRERTGRELAPRPADREVSRPGDITERGVERFYAGDRAHTVGLSEERAAQIVRSSGNARSIAFLASLLIVLFVPLYWFYELGIPVIGADGRQVREEQAQYVTDVARGYSIYIDNCARCHGPAGEGGIGPPLNDQAKLYNAVLPNGDPGKGKLNPNYLHTVLEVGGRYVCGDPNSVMPAWLQPNGPLNYRQVEELVAFMTASKEIEFTYQPEHAEAGETLPPPVTVTGWRDPAYTPAPDATAPPACWRPYENPAFAGEGGAASLPPVENPGTAEQPRVIALIETADLTIVDESGARVTQIAVQPGETISFEITNEAGFAHNFFIGPAEALEGNQTQGLPGVPDFDSGTQSFIYEVGDEEAVQFACTVPGHYPGMHGDLVPVE